MNQEDLFFKYVINGIILQVILYNEIKKYKNKTYKNPIWSI